MMCSIKSNNSSFLNLRHVNLVFLLIVTVFIALPAKVRCKPYTDQSSGDERLYIHLDKQVYVAGESVRYKVYLLNGLSPDKMPCSRILYFTIADAKGDTRVNWRINLGDKPVSGSFAIPEDIKTGIYQLRAYTNLMRNNPLQQVCTQNILIVSLLEPSPESVMMPLTGDTVKRLQSRVMQNGCVLKVTTSKAEYAGGEKVRMEIHLDGMQQSDAIADLSVSVSEVTPFQHIIPESDIEDCLNRKDASLGKPEVVCTYRVENKGFILSGRIKRRDDLTPLINGKILLSVADSIAPIILYTNTDETGGFVFYLSSLYDNRDLILQSGGEFRYADYYWEIDQKSISADIMASEPILVPPQAVTFLNAIKDLRIIEAVYSEDRQVRRTETGKRDVNYFSPPDFIINPGDYAELVNFKEIADNILPDVRFAIRNKDYSLQILNKRSELWQENHMVLLNGVPFTDLAYIATLGTNEIRRIEVITENLFLGDLTLPGVVSIYTNDNQVPENFLKNNTLIYRNVVIPNDTEDYENPAETGTGEYVPDFRITLLWNPHVIITGNEPLTVEFPASQLKGLFAIQIRGLVGEGFAVSADTSFEVK